MKKFFALIAFGLLASVGLASAAANKVDICHVTNAEGNEFVVISIADAAYETHIGHGDVDVNDDGSCGDGDPGPDPT